MILPSVTKKENQDWLLANEETFLDYMSKTHSSYDLTHTYLHYETFNDAYVENMRKKIEISLRKKLKEEAELKKNLPTEKKKTSKSEKKIQTMEKIADEIEIAKDGDFLLD